MLFRSATAEDTATANQLHSFYLTFGVQYSHERHPYWTGANPDGWVLIQAPSEAHARRLAMRYFGINWSMLYDHLNFDEAQNKARYYPLGELALVTEGGALSMRHGIEAPAAHITPSNPEYHGVSPSLVVGVRVEGHLHENPSSFYDVELFHTGCAEEGRTLFRQKIGRAHV